MVAFCQMNVDAGKKTLRTKLGRGVGADREIIQAIRDAVGDDIRLRVDYNQAYTPAQAVQAIRAIEEYRIDVAEQPVRGTDYTGLAYVQKRVSTPLMAHEGCFSLQDITTLIALGGIEVVGINSERPGGVTAALRAIDYAQRQGLTALIHNQPLGIASAMHLHLAVVKHYALGHDTELAGHTMFESDLLLEEIDYSKGSVSPPSGPGWGVQLDEVALEKYKTAPTTVLA